MAQSILWQDAEYYDSYGKLVCISLHISFETLDFTTATVLDFGDAALPSRLEYIVFKCIFANIEQH